MLQETTSVKCKTVSAFLVASTFFLHSHGKCREDYIGKELRDSTGFKSRPSNESLIAIFTKLVVMAWPNLLLNDFGECLWNYILHDRGRGFESHQDSENRLVAQSGRARMFHNTLSPINHDP